VQYILYPLFNNFVLLNMSGSYLQRSSVSNGDAPHLLLTAYTKFQLLKAIIDEERIIDFCIVAIMCDLCNDFNLPKDVALSYIFQKFPHLLSMVGECYQQQPHRKNWKHNNLV
jgi:hypothetical protein